MNGTGRERAPVESRFIERGVLLPWSIAGVLAVVLMFESFHIKYLIDNFKFHDQIEQRELDDVHARNLDLAKRFAGTVSGLKIVTLAPAVIGAPQAMAVVAWDPGLQRGVLKTLSLPAAGPGEEYELWIADAAGNQAVSAGIVDPGSVQATFQPARPVSYAAKFEISLQQKSDSAPRRGPIILAGK